MSDRRFVVVVVSALVALLGVGVTLVSLLALRHPVMGSGELGLPTDQSTLLIRMVGAGAVIALAGVGTAGALVWRQLRVRTRPT